MIKTKDFLWSIHYFRAFAILNIMFVHLWKVSEDNSSNYFFILKTKEVLFHGSTLYFLFISGFLFHYLSHRFTTKKYYLRRIKSIVIPYVIISIISTIVFDNIGSKIDFSIDRYLIVLIKGTAQSHYWYIPYIISIIAISPLLLRIPKKYLNYIPVFLIFPLLGTRTDIFITIGQYVYFTPIYLFGIYTSIHIAEVYKFVKKNKLFLLSLTLIITLTLFLTTEELTIYSHFHPTESLYYIQKMCITLLFLYYTKDINVNKYKWIDILAQISFSLFFFHRIFDYQIFKYFKVWQASMPNVLVIPISVLYVLFVIIIISAFCLITKRILGKYSQYLIGY